MTDKTNRGLWACKVCGTNGTGGVKGWERHYFVHHYIEALWTADMQGRDSSPHAYGNNA